MEGPHSLFGFLWQVASATGWKLHYILWRVDYLTLRLMLMDQPRYVPPRKKETGMPGAGYVPDPADRNDIAAQFKAHLKQIQK